MHAYPPKYEQLGFWTENIVSWQMWPQAGTRAEVSIHPFSTVAWSNYDQNRNSSDVPLTHISECIWTLLLRNTKSTPPKVTCELSNSGCWLIQGCWFAISTNICKTEIQKIKKKNHKPPRSVPNANVFVYDGFNTEWKINGFWQLHSRPINRSDTTKSIQRKSSWVIYTTHVWRKKLKIQNLASLAS